MSEFKMAVPEIEVESIVQVIDQLTKLKFPREVLLKWPGDRPIFWKDLREALQEQGLRYEVSGAGPQERNYINRLISWTLRTITITDALQVAEALAEPVDSEVLRFAIQYPDGHNEILQLAEEILAEQYTLDRRVADYKISHIEGYLLAAFRRIIG